MATTIGTESDPKRFLYNLIELDYDAVEAYEQAVARSDDATNKQKLSEFMADHQRHISELSGALRALGETPPQKGDIKRLLTQGKVVLASIRGDEAILRAMKTNEDDTNTAYERAVGRADVSRKFWPFSGVASTMSAAIAPG